MNKAELRKRFLELRSSLPAERRQEAEARANAYSPRGTAILSYSAFRGELDLTPLNHRLAKEGRLALPRVNEDELEIYLVQSPETELVLSNWGILEPAADFCQMLPFDELSHILVPALAFDEAHHRLGYGKGYYDRLLTRMPHIPATGIGFREQLVDTLPYDPHDCILSQLQLF